MRKLIKKIDFGLLLLVVITGWVCVVNWSSGTFLSGWDTLHPEFNFLLNLKRIVWGVWREEQGLGAVAGHAHMSELPRLVFLWLASIVLPVEFSRYFFFFTCLFLGVGGSWFYLKESGLRKGSCFLGGLFYLLNLGTLQHFYVPFEMFAVLYGFLPWLLLLAKKVLEGKPLWVPLVLVNFLASSMAYAPVLWYVYFAFLGFYVAACLFLLDKALWKRGILILLLVIVGNLYWILPNFYFLRSSAKDVVQAKTNLMFSERAFLTDEKYANFKDAIQLKGFLFDWQKYEKGKFVFLLGDWKEHLSLPVINILGYMIFGVVVLGIWEIFKKKKKKEMAIVFGFLFAFAFLIHGVPIVKQICDFLRQHFDIFKEGLRFPWTKFSLFVMFGYSLFFAEGIEFLQRFLKRKKVARFCLITGIVVVLVVRMLPVFQGRLISPLMRIKIPEEYFEMYKWFSSNSPNARVAVLPAVSYWGWEYYSFGFEGAGFLWFGMPQSVLVRDFDRWSPFNENFYWELSYAVETKNKKLLESVLEKYDVDWVLLDENLISPTWPRSLDYSESESLLKSEKFNLVNTFGKIKIYKFNREDKGWVYLVDDLPKINSFEWGNWDKGFEEYGDYIAVEENKKFDVYYPFRSLFTGRKEEEFKVGIKEEGEEVVFEVLLPEELKNYLVELPEGYKGEELVFIDPETYETKYFLPTVYLREGKLQVRFPKIEGVLGKDLNPVDFPDIFEAKNCNQFGGGKVETKRVDWGKTEAVRIEAEDATNCSVGFWLPDLPHKYGYLISFESRNVSGRPGLFWVENLTNRKADLEVYLSDQLVEEQKSSLRKSFFIQPPMAEDGMGWGLHFDSLSIGRQKTINELGKITIYPIPYRFLTSLKLINPSYRRVDLEKLKDLSGQVEVEHPNPAFYEVQIDGEVGKNGVLVLSQAYHKGWAGYLVNQDLAKNKNSFLIHFFPFLFGKRLEKVKVNNWENGWLLGIMDNQREIILVFLPQYLEYIGFLIFVLELIVLLSI